jgi:SAM-dependent methyltransferase
VRATADRVHAAAREQIRAGGFDRARFRAEVAALPALVRDHHVEEVLGVAYPPLEDAASPRAIFHVAPSGLAEILFALDVSSARARARLGASWSFVDLGSGCGKAVLLAALLTGADATGIELDPALVRHARGAADMLGLDRATFRVGDLRAASLPEADAYYMYIPFVGSAELVARLEPIARARPFVLFCQALDVRPFPWLRALHLGSYWLEVYEAGR